MIDGEVGLQHMWALSVFGQALRRESPEWHSMSKDARIDEILAHVENAAKSRWVRNSNAQAETIAKEFLVGRRDEWPYWVAKSKEKSQEGWFAWHVVRAIVEHLLEEDRKLLQEPPLGDWLAGHFKNPKPSRPRGAPKGGRSELHKVAVLGVYALVDAGLCDVTGNKKKHSRSACELVGERLDLTPRRVHDAWRAHRTQLAESVDVFIYYRVTAEESEPCPHDTLLRAVNHVAGVRRLFSRTVFEAWKKDGRLAEWYGDVEFGSKVRFDR